MSSILLVSPLKATAQDVTKKEEKENFWHLFAFKGIGFSADIFGCAASLVNDHISTEVALEANFGNRLYPIVEVGYGWCNTTDETSGIKYSANAPYYKAGFNYNFFTKKEKPDPKHYVYGLVRLGWSSFKYDVTTPPISDPVWGGEVPFSHSDVSGFASWVELGVGVNAKIWKQIRMGWCIRYKARLNVVNGEYSRVGYIPGFGSNRHTRFGATYSIIYEIPFKKK